MGKEQSTLAKKDYVIEEETEIFAAVTKGDDKFLVKKIKTPTNQDFISEAEILKTVSHPHIVSWKNSFKDEDESIYYAVTDYCHGGNLADKIKDGSQEFQVLSWLTEISVALRTIHEKGLVQKDLTPEDIFLTEFGTVRLCGFQKAHKNTKTPQSTTNSESLESMSYMAPEVLTQGTYDAKRKMQLRL
uniref:serine/threonine-protein kinase Nek3-like n=1 Tax=Monopterus albus TaxID=43700 RepID=UPI0009B2F40D|nr:serine/threonine-protein kinase Nek3-like [Monopterus albus]